VVAVSFGSLASQISLPCYMSHASIPAAIRAARGLPDDLVRISAGVEDAADLLHDLEAAFATAASALGLPRPPPRVEAALARAAEAAGAGREAALERRIAALEGELEAAKARGGR
jgi:cystathionine beta-lyase